MFLRGKKIPASIFLASIILGLTIQPARAETIQIPCGSNATYELILPSGVALNGSKCSGDLILDPRVRTLGKNVFQFSKITSIVLSDSVTKIDSGALSYVNAKAIKFGSSLENVGFEAFRMSRFTSFDLPNSLIEIGECAFCDTYFESLVIPKSVEIIGNNAFSRSDSGVPLKRIEIPSSVKNIGTYSFAFAGLEVVKIGSGITSIPGGAFSYNKLQKVIIPKGVRFIGAFAFKFNPLKEIEIPDTVTGIDSEAFANTQITKLNLPDSVVNIGTRAFADIKTLKSITFSEKFDQRRSDNSIWIGDIFDGSYALEEVIYCGTASGFIIQPKCTAEKQAAMESKKVDLRSKFLSEVLKIDLATLPENNDSVDIAEMEDEAKNYLGKLTIVDSEIKSKKISSYSKLENSKLLDDLRVAKSKLESNIKQIQINFENCIDKGVLIVQNNGNTRGWQNVCAKYIKSKNYLEKVNKFASDVTERLTAAVEISSAAPTPSIKPSPKNSTMTPKSLTIICAKGKTIKKITAVNPKCPSGYKKKIDSF